MDPVYPGLTDEIIDLAKFIDTEKLKENKKDIIKAKSGNKAAYRKTFNYFRAAGSIYKEIEQSNSLLVDSEGVNREIASLIEKVFSKQPLTVKSNGFKERHLFSTANSPIGFVDYTDTILEGVGDVYYIAGQIGVGISRLMAILADKAAMMNYNIEVYHDSMIPENIESLYIKEIDTMITSNDYGSEYQDKTIDLDQYIDQNKIDNDDYQIYEILVRKGIDNLSNAKKNHFILEKAYRPSIDYTGVDKVKSRILNEIMEKIKA